MSTSINNILMLLQVRMDVTVYYTILPTDLRAELATCSCCIKGWNINMELITSVLDPCFAFQIQWGCYESHTFVSTRGHGCWRFYNECHQEVWKSKCDSVLIVKDEFADMDKDGIWSDLAISLCYLFKFKPFQCSSPHTSRLDIYSRSPTKMCYHDHHIMAVILWLSAHVTLDLVTEEGWDKDFGWGGQCHVLKVVDPILGPI